MVFVYLITYVIHANAYTIKDRDEVEKIEFHEEQHRVKSLREFRIGPMFGFGLFMGPNISIDARIFRYIGFGVTYSQYEISNLFSYYPIGNYINKGKTGFSLNGAQLAYKQFEGKLFVYPWGDHFYLGSSFGKRDLKLNFQTTINSIVPIGQLTPISPKLDNELQLYSLYVSPLIGWTFMWETDSAGAFAIGRELGVQFNVAKTDAL